MEKELRIFVADTISVSDKLVRKIRKWWRAMKRLVFRAVRSVIFEVKTYTLTLHEMGRSPSVARLAYKEVGIPMAALWL